MSELTIKGNICGISGPTVVAERMVGARMYTTALVGEARLLGEIICIQGDRITLQVYEDTTGLRLEEEVISYGKPLTVELGPGLLTSVFDGIQRPLEALRMATGDFIKKGVTHKALDRSKRWGFTPLVKEGDAIGPGDVLGEVEETKRILHRVLVPPGVSGVVDKIEEGEYTSDEPVVFLRSGKTISMIQEWPVRTPRPFKERLTPDTPFITGQRVFDTIFPVAEGGVAIVPGGFGTGKTVVEQTLARFARSDIIVYIGCGERGNEMTEVLTDFPKFLDPSTGLPLILRTILIVNTSNMPVAAREASIFTGITIAEYYRDMGYNVALMADSTSRWAEALREVSSRLEEMPSEEGYPSYLAARLGSFYERAGRFRCMGGPDRIGFITVVSAISPPGGDFSEPVTQASLRVAGALWALNTDLAYRRHFPAVDWNVSFSLYHDGLIDWFTREVGGDMTQHRDRAMALLQKEGELKEIVQLIGLEALQDSDRLTMEVGMILREGFLRQSIFNEVDASCSMGKQYWMLKAILTFHDLSQKALKDGVFLEQILDNPVRAKLLRMVDISNEGFTERAKELIGEMEKGFTLINQNAKIKMPVCHAGTGRQNDKCLF
ncbi:MAG: V-type ATP synthase subunit A [Deltaproteobacteria bacterium]|nr:V-type ATP synthase subunit A [Deltaproteobacteria bacterium]